MKQKTFLDFSKLENVSIQWLHDAGISSLKILKEIGAVEAYVRVKRLHPGKTSLNLLWGLYGALNNKKWNEVTEQEKSVLKSELKQYGL